MKNKARFTVAKDGFSIETRVIDSDSLKQLIAEISPFLDDSAAGVRDIANISPSINMLTQSTSIRSLIEPILGSSAVLVRSILFNKTKKVNWKVTWHQDLSIAVDNKAEISGYGPWSTKEGILHVQPPESVLHKMITVRLHLDNTSSENGALVVSPKTHLLGKIPSSQAHVEANKAEPYICAVYAGDVVLMRPLLLHSSRKATRPSQRRILHFEFSSAKLPDPLRWYGVR